MVRTPRFHCWGPGFDPLRELRSLKPRIAAKKKKKKRGKKKKATEEDTCSDRGREWGGGVRRKNIQRKQTHELVHSFVQLLLSTTVLGAGIQIKTQSLSLRNSEMGYRQMKI